MNIEKYTERARGFIQSAQSLALREGHQQFTPEHVLKVLLDDPEGLAAGLIDRSGGNSRQALSGVEAALGKMPKVSGSGSGQVYLAAGTARLFDNAEKIADKAGRVGTLFKEKKPLPAVVQELYLVTLSRAPRAEETDKALEAIAGAPTPREGVEDLLWALLNSREFLFNH